MRFFIVVASFQNRATGGQTRYEVAGSIILVGIGVKVAGLWACASLDGVATAIVHSGRAVVVVRKFVGATRTAGVFARAIVDLRKGVKVAGVGQRATGDEAAQVIT